MVNIRYGRLDATDDDCIEAGKLSRADSFIEKLPDGYKTVISEENGSLSQEQRQMLSIACCLVANPLILILDEATSSIDTRTEKLLAEGMGELMKGRTTFVIAHRLSTIRDADTIMVLENGQIVERSTRQELTAITLFVQGNLHLTDYLGFLKFVSSKHISVDEDGIILIWRN